MSLDISSPNDAVENRKNSVLISWISETPGQVAYEFQYKLSTSSFWSTLGKVNSTSQSAYVNLSSITDGTLYHYRLAVYYEHTDEVGVDYQIIELSPAYSLVLTTNRLGILKIKTGLLNNDVEQTPLYDDVNKNGPRIKVAIEDNVIALGSFNNNGEIDDFQSDFKVKIEESDDAKRTIREYGNFYYTTIESQAYRADRYSYLYFVPEKWDYAYNLAYPYYEDRSYSYHSGYYYVKTGSHTEYFYIRTDHYDVQHSEQFYYTYKYDARVDVYQGGVIAYSYIAFDRIGTGSGTRYWYTRYSVDVYGSRQVDDYERRNSYSYRWYLYMYYEYYYNVYQDHYKYGYDYEGYTYDRRYITYYYNNIPVYGYLSD